MTVSEASRAFFSTSQLAAKVERRKKNGGLFDLFCSSLKSFSSGADSRACIYMALNWNARQDFANQEQLIGVFFISLLHR